MAILTTDPQSKESSDYGMTSGQIPFGGADGLVDLVLSTGLLQVDYFLEKFTDGGSNATLVPLPSQPQNVEVRRIYTENTVYTFDPEYSFREIAAPRVVEVVLSGQTGVGLRLGLNDDGGLTYTQGYNHLQSFEKFIDRYMHKAASDFGGITGDKILLNKETNYNAKPFLVFRGIKENLHGRCSVKSLSYQRSVNTNRMGSYSWQLVLMVYDGYEAKDPTRFGFMSWADDATAFVNSLTGLSEAIFGGLQAGIGQIARDVGNIADATVGLAASIQDIDNKVYGSIESVMTTVDKCIGALDALSGILDGDQWTRDATDFAANQDSPKTMWNTRDFFDNEMVNRDTRKREGADTWDSQDNVAISFEEQQAALTMQETMYQAWLLVGVADADRARKLTAEEVQGFLQRGVSFSALASLFRDKDNQPDVKRYAEGYSMTYEMRPGQSLLTIANSFLGDPSRWVDIANLNRMPDAYTKSDGTVLMSGDAILIPTDAESGFTFVTTEPRDVNAVIGHDLGFSGLGDLVWETIDQDQKLVTGVENLKQTIERLLKTTCGDVTMDPNYGVNFAIIGTALNETVATLIAAKIRERLMMDTRILDVIDMTVAVNPDRSDTLDVSLTCVCVGQNDIVVSTQMETK